MSTKTVWLAFCRDRLEVIFATEELAREFKAICERTGGTERRIQQWYVHDDTDV